MSKYLAAYADPQGPGDARPTALDIVRDNDMEGKLTGKVAVITGVSSGIGLETARALGVTGATLYLTARDLNKTKQAVEAFMDPSRMELIEMDQSSLESVRTAAKAILAKTDKVHILINNAGVMVIPTLEKSKDGHELQFATNHLSHFLFFNLLKPAMLNAINDDFPPRVINVASGGHRVQGLNDSDNYDWQKGNYHPFMAYAQSKTANILMANEIDRRYGPRGLHASSLHPGIVYTELGRHMSEETLQGMVSNPHVLKVLKNPDQGATTTVWATLSKEWEGKGGRYLIDCKEAEKGPDDGDDKSDTYTSHTYDPKEEARLWKDSLRMVGLSEDE